jgi:aminopeptidase N/puromycin-sensitive aminopeptidase
VTLAQERYFANAAKLAAGFTELWQIPVHLRAAGSKDAAYRLLTQRRQTFELPGCSPWVYPNVGGRGHYRTSYDPAAFVKMSAELETAFSPEERIHFLGDAWAMVRVGRLSIGDYLAMLEKLQAERSRAVVEVMIFRIAEIHDTVVAAADRPAFEKWVRNFLRPIADDLGDTPAPGESDDRRGLRPDVFAVLTAYGRDPQLLAKSRTIVEAYMKDPASVDAALAGSALPISAFEGDAALYDKYVEHLKTPKTPEESSNYLGAIGQFRDPALTKRTFDLFLGPVVKNQDLFYLFGPLANYDTQPAAWELFKTDFKAIQAKAGPGLGAGFAQVAGVFCDEKLRDDSQQFFAAQNLPGAERPLQNAKDTVNACIELRSLQQAKLSAYLKKSSPTTSAGAAH